MCGITRIYRFDKYQQNRTKTLTGCYPSLNIGARMSVNITLPLHYRLVRKGFLFRIFRQEVILLKQAKFISG
jgi:hypothetical protein